MYVNVYVGMSETALFSLFFSNEARLLRSLRPAPLLPLNSKHITFFPSRSPFAILILIIYFWFLQSSCIVLVLTLVLALVLAALIFGHILTPTKVLVLVHHQHEFQTTVFHDVDRIPLCSLAFLL